MLFNLEKESLLASGLKDNDRLVEYRGKLDQLTKQFIGQMKPSHEPVEKARFLFDWLWEKNRDGTNIKVISDYTMSSMPS